MKPVSLLIVEDIPQMQELLKHVLEGVPEIRVSGVALNTVEARQELNRRRPQVVLLDEVLPGESSTDLLLELTADGIAVVLMTSMEKPEHSVPPEAHSRVVKPGWDTIPADRERLKGAILAAAGRSLG